MGEAWIIDAVRTPRGRGKKDVGALSGISADPIATVEGFSRADVDAFALRSQERCQVAQKEDRFEHSATCTTPGAPPASSTGPPRC